MASSVNNSPWMEWITSVMGAASRTTYAATLPPDRYFCLLDELPLHLIPRSALATTPKAYGDLFLNPDCTICPAESLPEEIANQKEVRSAFALQGNIAWVRDPDHAPIPFWLGPKLQSAIDGLRPGEPIPPSVDASTRSILQAAGIVTSSDLKRNEHLRRKEKIANAAALFGTRGYAPLPELLHPFHIAALRRYYRYKIRTGALHLGDGQSPRRYISYNDPVARFFHQRITSTLSAVADAPIKPSYAYLASYLSGAELPKHTDREQCEFSITLCLDFTPEPTLATPWPLHLDTPTGTVKVYQALGDGLAYRGTRLPHYRSKLAEGQTSTSIFFHYVPADFTGSLD